jgi:hypothetical protein
MFWVKSSVERGLCYADEIELAVSVRHAPYLLAFWLGGRHFHPDR